MQLAKLSQAQGSGSTFRPRLNYVRWSHFQTRLPTRSKELPFPAPDNREGIKTPYGRVVEGGRERSRQPHARERPKLHIAIPMALAFTMTA
jgi:hypothetical protein